MKAMSETESAEFCHYNYIDKCRISSELRKAHDSVIRNKYGTDGGYSSPCDCKRDGESWCGDNTCANRQIHATCGPDCGVGCKNAPWNGRGEFAAGRKTYMKVHPVKRFCVFASEHIEEGSLIGEYTGIVHPKTEADRLEDKSYVMAFKYVKQAIDAKIFGSIVTRINHSCTPNCIAHTYVNNMMLHIVYVAKDDILPGQELTINYGWTVNQKDKDSRTPCMCGAPGLHYIETVKTATRKVETVLEYDNKEFIPPRQISQNDDGMDKKWRRTAVVDSPTSPNNQQPEIVTQRNSKKLRTTHTSTSISSSVDGDPPIPVLAIPTTLQQYEKKVMQNDASPCKDTKLTTALWKLPGSKEVVYKNIDDPLMRFLRGSSLKDFNPIQLIQFLQSEPEEKVGKFIVALLCIEYVQGLDFDQLVQMYEKNENESPEVFSAIISEYAAYRFHKHFRSHLESFETVNVYPKTVRPKLAVKLLRTGAGRRYLSNMDNCAATIAEEQHVYTINKALLDFMMMDLESNDVYLSDNTMSRFERSKLWMRLQLDFVRSIVKEELPISASKLLMNIIMELEVDCTTYFTVDFEGDTPKKAFRAHPAIVQQWCKHPVADSKVIIRDATLADLKTFSKMIQDIDRETCYLKQVTFAVYQMAKQINIADIGSFLFRPQSRNEFTEQQKGDILKIMVSMRVELKVNDFAAEFSTWMRRKQDRLLSMNGLSAADVIYFLGRKNLAMFEIEVYEILKRWSYHACGKDYPRDFISNEDEEVAVKFNEVRGVLYLMALEKYYDTLVVENFVKNKDIVLVEALCVGKNNSSGTIDLWFPIGNRADA